ncbi:MAG TPA: prolipoprotein diacylglyceryl transferase [Bacteroidales bacterium]|nr:prolipoprotein diacylglyceryl transferase [Bacteroidales bacterium]
MLSIFTYIQWSPDPVIFEIAGRGIRWYGLLLATGFLLSYLVLAHMLKKESWTQQRIDVLAIYVIVGVVIGLRLGHCLFYNPVHYLSNPVEILKVWEGGLASHGGAAGILIALALFCSKYKYNYLHILDRVAAIVLLAGSFVRIGNLMNSEIYGIPTQMPWAFVFAKADLLPRHPTQLYEGIFYFFCFFAMLWLFNKKKNKWLEGVFLGWFLIILFVFRFVIEFTKESQIEFSGWTLPLDMGQLLSIPFVIIGLILVFRKPKPEPVNNKPAGSKARKHR